MINIFYKNKKSKLSFRDHVAIQNDILFEYVGSTNDQTTECTNFPLCEGCQMILNFSLDNLKVEL